MTTPNILWTVVSGFFATKFLLIYCYYSTDFEVHRNWLAITHNLPMSKWYFENTSEWTLDYPPFFAWFELLLSKLAALYHPELLKISQDGFFDEKTLFFQRMTVIASDLLLIYAAFRCSSVITKRLHYPIGRKDIYRSSTVLLLVCSAALLLVDNIHFQYNGFLSGILLLSLSAVMDGKLLIGAFWFCVLCNFKHIYLYMAPAYAAYYLRWYCLGENFSWNPFKMIRIVNCLKLALTLGFVFVISLAPFVYLGQIGQLVTRLFPVQRGLTHAYWAPNIWALYNCVDLLLYKVVPKLTGVSLTVNATAVPTYILGLVQEYDHMVLPNVKPFHTALLTLISALPLSVFVRRDGFVESVVLCAFASFQFGWHVHEKAIVLLLLPYAILALNDRRHVANFLMLTAIGHTSLFPLFFNGGFESPIKYTSVGLYSLGAALLLNRVHASYRSLFACWSHLECVYVFGLVVVEIYSAVGHRIFGLEKRAPFLPLLLTSVFGSVGMFGCWIRFLWLYLCSNIHLDTRIYTRIWKAKQMELRKRVIEEQNSTSFPHANGVLLHGKYVRLIGGLDASSCKFDAENCQNAVVSLAIISYPDLTLVHSLSSPVTIELPYIPGLLAFREAKFMVDLVQELRETSPEFVPDVLFVDGNGVLHPRECGLACHIGVETDLPTIGVAKNLHHLEILSDESVSFSAKGAEKIGSYVDLKSRVDPDRVLGRAVWAGLNSKNAVFVSIGHRIDLNTATALLIRTSNYRICEPIRHADSISREAVRRLFDN